MKMKNKGKVHPSPSMSPSTSNNNNKEKEKENIVSDVLSLLPATLLTLLSLLSLEDREVLAYLITFSLKTTTTTVSKEAKRRPAHTSAGSKTPSDHCKKNSKNLHNEYSPVFDCDCFDCYTSYWTKWDASPNRYLIHQALEAFEEQHNLVEESKQSLIQSRKSVNGSRSNGKKKDKKVVADLKLGTAEMAVSASESVFPTAEGGGGGGGGVGGSSYGGEMVAPVAVLEEEMADVEEMPAAEEEEEVVVTSSLAAEVGGGNRRGLARKVLPDVLGLFNSRLWSFWNPNV